MVLIYKVVGKIMLEKRINRFRLMIMLNLYQTQLIVPTKKEVKEEKVEKSEKTTKKASTSKDVKEKAEPKAKKTTKKEEKQSIQQIIFFI